MTGQRPAVLQAIDLLTDVVERLEGVAETMGGDDEPDPPWVDLSDTMPVNWTPFHPGFKKSFPRQTTWPRRRPGEVPYYLVDGLTIHHTTSHSPVATARFCAFTKGYPCIQYHFWVSADDSAPVYLLLDPDVMTWHDHTGRLQTALSIGMAGHLDLHKPPQDQLESVASLVAFLMYKYNVPVHKVKGHCDRPNAKGTVCPGWDVAHWRDDFNAALLGELNG